MRTLFVLAIIFSILRTDTHTIIYADPIVRPIKPVAHLEALPATKLAEVGKVTIPKPKPVITAPKGSGTINCGDSVYKQYIYKHESGCNTASTNSQGCFGIGQDCNGIVRSRCGTDFACQDAYFTQYAINRYGGWAQAYTAWTIKHWW